jgi:hypothetical protein
MNRYNKAEKVAAPPLASKRLLDQVRERIRYLHYSLKTEKAYLYWVRFFVLWSGQQGGMRHPKNMGSAEVEAFLTMLATQRQVSPSTHRQALNALLFLYRDVLCMDLPWKQQIGRPPERLVQRGIYAACTGCDVPASWSKLGLALVVSCGQVVD